MWACACVFECNSQWISHKTPKSRWIFWIRFNCMLARPFWWLEPLNALYLIAFVASFDDLWMLHPGKDCVVLRFINAKVCQRDNSWFGKRFKLQTSAREQCVFETNTNANARVNEFWCSKKLSPNSSKFVGRWLTYDSTSAERSERSNKIGVCVGTR